MEGEHTEYHIRRRRNDVANSKFVAANVINAYKLEKARRKVDEALAEGEEEMIDTRDPAYAARIAPQSAKRTPERAAASRIEEANIESVRIKPARAPLLRSEAQKEVALRVASAQKSQLAHAQFQYNSAWAEAQLGRSQVDSAIQVARDVHMARFEIRSLNSDQPATHLSSSDGKEPPAMDVAEVRAPSATTAATPVSTPMATAATPAVPTPAVSCTPKATGTWRDYL